MGKILTTSYMWIFNCVGGQSPKHLHCSRTNSTISISLINVVLFRFSNASVAIHVFQGICPFYPSFQMHRHKVVVSCDILLLLLPHPVFSPPTVPDNHFPTLCFYGRLFRFHIEVIPCLSGLCHSA